LKYVGVTSRIYTEENEKNAVNTEYFEAVRKAGLCPIILPCNENAKDLLDLCSGFLVTGGADINPKWYGQKIEKNTVVCSDSEDILDKLVIGYALENNRPLFGICRGLQALNVHLGGTLKQNITGHVNTSHKVKILEKGLLYNKDEINVNSNHHQAIDVLSERLHVIGESEEGIPEIVIMKDKPVFAVQFHPERAPFDKDCIFLFEKLAKMMEE